MNERPLSGGIGANLNVRNEGVNSQTKSLPTSCDSNSDERGGKPPRQL
jgi:hypothetical protein